MHAVNKSAPSVLEVLVCCGSNQQGAKLSWEQSVGESVAKWSKSSQFSVDGTHLAVFLNSFHLSNQTAARRSFTQHKVGGPTEGTDPSFMWINILDISTLPALGLKFSIHELCMAGFSDLRMHSSVISVNGELLISICVAQIVNNYEISVCK